MTRSGRTGFAIRTNGFNINEDLSHADFLRMEIGFLMRFGGLSGREAGALAALVLRSIGNRITPEDLPPAEEMRARIRRLRDEIGRVDPNSIDYVIIAADAGLIFGGLALTGADAGAALAGNFDAAWKSIPAGLKAIVKGTERYRG